MSVDWMDQQSFQFASESSKQLISLTVGILGLTGALSKNIVASGHPWRRRALVASWVSYAASLIFGLIYLLGLTTALDSDKQQFATLQEPSRGVRSDHASARLEPRSRSVIIKSERLDKGQRLLELVQGPTIWDVDLRQQIGAQLVSFGAATAIMLGILISVVRKNPKAGIRSLRRRKAVLLTRSATRRRRAEDLAELQYREEIERFGAT